VSSVKKIPVICTNHVPNDWTYKKLGWRAFWYKFIDVFTNLIAYKIVNTGVSDYVTATMKHLKNVKIVENGVETPEIKYEIPKKIRRFGYMGRIVNIKGVEEIILAFDKLRKEKNDVSLIIKGSDITPKKKWISKYKKIVTNKNIPVIFEDFSNDIESFYSKIDCYVLFTYPGFEGFSLTSLESVFRNRLIISSEDGAPIIKKYIKESIVPSKNIEKLYEKMLEFHEYSENDIKNIIKKYDILKKKYNLKTMCENYYEIYKQVVKK
jgi:glycosyltransferase involved in cell wall biosynthesis